jgi:hypothetical protein
MQFASGVDAGCSLFGQLMRRKRGKLGSDSGAHEIVTEQLHGLKVSCSIKPFLEFVKLRGYRYEIGFAILLDVRVAKEI